MSRSLAAAILVLASASAHADVWQRALDPSSVEVANDTFAREMREGDDHVLLANTQNSSREEMKRQVRLAVQKYRNAAAARPKSADPYFRIGATLYSFYLDSCQENPNLSIRHRSPLRDCNNPDAINTAIAQETIDAWVAAEARVPLDPRFSSSAGDSLLFARALLNTRLNTKASLAAATLDYENYIDRSDSAKENPNLENALSNVAETYMMLGRIDESIAAYREAAIRGGGTEVSTIYGLAVALDRGERHTAAAQLMASRKKEGYESFRRRVESGATFFVPPGEVYYYYALAEESLGDIDRAIDHWRLFIQSKAHPQYQPRAKEHLDELLAKRQRQTGRPVPPHDPLWDNR